MKHSLYSIALILLLFITTTPFAQTQAAPTAQTEADKIELYQALLDLTNPWTVMCVAAHPDDEDGATLTVLRRKYGAHTVTLFSTYGEGGQNAIGPELYEELGAIRARETLNAAQIQGSEAHFLALRDFGFSKSADEAFRVWGHDEALRRMVLEIRLLRPDVIITNHDETGGHGHHQATGRLVLEAFDAAADPTKFPEQMKSVRVWQVQRLFVRAGYEGGAASKALDNEAARAGKIITVNPNERDPARGSTYAEQALQALQQHASQGPWPQQLPKEGGRIIRYRLAREARDAPPLPANAATFLDGLKMRDELSPALSQPTIDGRPLVEFINEPERIFDAYSKPNTEHLPDAPFDEPNAPSRDAKEEQHLENLFLATENLLAATSRIKLTLTPDETNPSPDSDVSFTLTVTNNGSRPAILKSIHFIGFTINKISELQRTLAPQQSATFKQRIRLPRDAAINLPAAKHLYDEQLFGQSLLAVVSVEVAGYKFNLPLTSGRVYVAPAVEIQSVTPSPLVLTPATLQRPATFKLRLINHQSAPFAGRLKIDGHIPSSVLSSDTELVRKAAGATPRISLKLKAQEAQEVEVPLPDLSKVFSNEMSNEKGHSPALKGLVSFTVNGDSGRALTQENVSVVYSDARVAPGLRVGYVRSTDDTLRNALNALGVEAKELSVEDIRAGELGKYDTIIIDNRGYQLHPELIAANTRLLQFAEKGGTLVVFYHKTNEWNPDAAKSRPQLAPYALTLGSERVTDENAPVNFDEPQHPLLNFPNKISADDFKDWVQERGLYYPREWDAHYQALFSMSDAGEQPLRGGLLAADYGRGHYIYTSMVWYRQLRAGLPGAYRVFANMISYGRAARANSVK